MRNTVQVALQSMWAEATARYCALSLPRVCWQSILRVRVLKLVPDDDPAGQDAHLRWELPRLAPAWLRSDGAEFSSRHPDRYMRTSSGHALTRYFLPHQVSRSHRAPCLGPDCMHGKWCGSESRRVGTSAGSGRNSLRWQQSWCAECWRPWVAARHPANRVLPLALNPAKQGPGSTC